MTIEFMGVENDPIFWARYTIQIWVQVLLYTNEIF